ncbi:MAG: PAS domain S-box protein [Deltaproteobacteria bacterium]|nr:PAS domain S-box protein [Deltaproteobacteria bacterium]
MLVAALSLLTLSEDVFGWNLGLDQIIFQDRTTTGTFAPGRMSPATSFCFFLTGSSLFFLKQETRHHQRPAQWLVIVVALISLLALIGYAYGVQSLYRVAPFSSMAAHTAFTFLVLSAGVLFEQPERGPVAIILQESIGGVLARRLLLPAFIIPFAVGWLRLQAEHAGYFNTEFGVALFAAVNIAIFVSLVLWVARPLDRAEAERQRGEEHFHQVIECAPNGMVMVDQAGKIVLVNAQIEKSFGYSRAELIGQSIEMLVPQRFRSSHSAYRSGFLADPTVRPMGAGRDLYGLRHDGSEFPVEIGLNPLETAHGLMVLGTIVDITERKRAEQSMRKNQEQLAGVIGSAMDAIITVDGAQRIILFNAAAEKMFHCPAETALGQSLDQFIPARFRAGHYNHIREFGETKVSKRTMGALGALFGLRTDGEEFPIEASISQLEAEGERFYTVILRDITERKRAEAAVRESEEKYRTLFESIDQGFCTIEVLFDETARAVDYRFLTVNPAFERQTGIENAAGRWMREIAPLHEEHWFELYGRIALTGTYAAARRNWPA